MGEGAGAGELVAEALRGVARAWSLRPPATRLTEAFMQLTGALDADDLLEGLTLERYHLNAEAARSVFRVAADGDVVACQAIEWAGKELASLAIGVIRQLNFERLDFDAVLVGSLFDGGSLLSEPLFRAVRAVAPGVRFLRLSAPPIIGGVMIGMEIAGCDPRRVHTRLIESTQELYSSRQGAAMGED